MSYDKDTHFFLVKKAIQTRFNDTHVHICETLRALGVAAAYSDKYDVYMTGTEFMEFMTSINDSDPPNHYAWNPRTQKIEATWDFSDFEKNFVVSTYTHIGRKE